MCRAGAGGSYALLLLEWRSPAIRHGHSGVGGVGGRRGFISGPTHKRVCSCSPGQNVLHSLRLELASVARARPFRL